MFLVFCSRLEKVKDWREGDLFLSLKKSEALKDLSTVISIWWSNYLQNKEKLNLSKTLSNEGLIVQPSIESNTKIQKTKLSRWTHYHLGSETSETRSEARRRSYSTRRQLALCTCIKERLTLGPTSDWCGRLFPSETQNGESFAYAILASSQAKLCGLYYPSNEKLFLLIMILETDKRCSYC